VEPDDTVDLAPGDHRYSCVVIQGTLRIHDYVRLQATTFILDGRGTIDGRGRGRSSLGDGHNGHSRFGRGSGGGGGSSVCEGGSSAPLDDGETPPGLAGDPSPDMIRPGAHGGRGGDREREGGEGGNGGASLGIIGGGCLVAGKIDVSGTRGEDAGDGGDGGGGGGGSGGNIDLTCTQAHFHLSSLNFWTNGGAGGDGGTASDQDGFYYGGGGGGGAGGATNLTIEAATIVRNRNEGPVRSNAAFVEALQSRVNMWGGRGGSGGDVQNPSEDGDNGGNCRLGVSIADTQGP